MPKTKSTSSFAGVAKRTLKEVVEEIRSRRGQGRTVPEISTELQVDPALIKQIDQQSYKSTVDSVALFDRQEQARVAAIPPMKKAPAKSEGPTATEPEDQE